MEFVESPLFAKRLEKRLSPEGLQAMENHLINRPDAGTLIPRGKGLRKLRWTAKGRGKSGGVRMIYYWYVSDDLIYLLNLYAKDEKSDLTPVRLAPWLRSFNQASNLRLRRI